MSRDDADGATMGFRSGEEQGYQRGLRAAPPAPAQPAQGGGVVATDPQGIKRALMLLARSDVVTDKDRIVIGAAIGLIATPAPAAPDEPGAGASLLDQFLRSANAAGFKTIHEVPGLMEALRATEPVAGGLPHISADENGCATLEWWSGDKKLTLYTVSSPYEALLKSWGGGAEFVSVLDAHAVRQAFQWLGGTPGAGVVEALRVLRNFEFTGPDADGLVWLVLHGHGTSGQAMFNLGSANRLAVQVALKLEEDRRAALAAQPAPIDMVLHCTKCGMQHIDEPCYEPGKCWTNPPHRSHLCHGCGHIWRPADVCTNGVAAVKTAGKADSPIVKPEDWLEPLREKAANYDGLCR